MSKENLTYGIIALIMFSVLVFENNILSKKISLVYKVMTNIEFYLKDGECE